MDSLLYHSKELLLLDSQKKYDYKQEINNSMALEVTDSNFEELVNSGKPMVLDFWAEWCGPCRMVGPIIDDLEKEYAGRVTVGKMDVDNNNDVVAQFGIRNIPTILFFKDGKVVDKQVGAAQKAAFVEKVEALLK